MRIGIDARFYGTLGKGLGRYMSELLRHLEQIDERNEYVIFLRRANYAEYQPQNPRFSKTVADYPWYGWREQLLFPLKLWRERLDLMHFGHFNVPLLYRRPFIVTVHDLILLSHPSMRATTLGPWLYQLKYWAYRLTIKNALRRSLAVLTVSEHSRQEILRLFPIVPAEKITVTHLACATKLAAATDAIEPLVAGRYFLYVGNAYPHKNLERLLTAFANFRRQGKHEDIRLVLVGAEDYFYRRLHNLARQLNVEKQVVFFGSADDLQLGRIYADALAYVFPSLCEGFGLPPLEAMCQGVPVAAARSSCLPEILDDAALWFDPKNDAEIVAVLAKLADDADLRQQLIAAGQRRAAKFDWRQTAQRTLTVYETAGHQHH